MKNTILLCLICLGSCYNHQEPEKPLYTIDPFIEKEVEKYIGESEFSMSNGFFWDYDNTLIVDYYENDSLIGSIETPDRKEYFKSFYYQYEKQLSIDGAFGMFGGFGFSIKFSNDQATVYHLVAADEIPTLAMTPTGELQYRLEVPCPESELILSKKPEGREDDIIYGMVKFKSTEYYFADGFVEEKEKEPRTKARVNMTIYFKARYAEIPD